MAPYATVHILDVDLCDKDRKKSVHIQNDEMIILEGSSVIEVLLYLEYQIASFF